MLTQRQRLALAEMVSDPKNTSVHLLGAVVTLVRLSADNQDQRDLADAIDKLVCEYCEKEG